MAANLAKELGLDESKVKAALEDFMPQGGPPERPGAPNGSAQRGTPTHHQQLLSTHARFAPAESRRRGGAT